MQTYYRKKDRKDRWEALLRVKYVGDEWTVADVWGWDNDEHKFTYIREIVLTTDRLIGYYNQITDEAEIKRLFTNTPPRT